MGLFNKNKKLPGWMAISFHADGLCAAYVRRNPSGLPSVEIAAFYPSSDSTNEAQLEKLARDLHVARYNCAALLAAGEYQMLTVDAPNVPVEELKTAIRWRLKDMLDFHVDDATIDVLDIPVDKNGGSRTHSMYAVAARNQLIEQRQTLFSNAKLSLTVIDIPEMAQRNLSVLMEPEGRGLALLSFDTEGGLLTVTYEGELYLSRRIDISLTQMLGASSEQKQALFERITLELQRSLDHFDRQFNFITVAKLMIFPAGAASAELPAYLADNLYVPVQSLSLDTLLDLSKVPELNQPENQHRFFKVLGAALRLEETVL